jgi:hypothetical protein
MPRTARWSDEDLIDAVGSASSMKQVCDRLGLWAGGGTYISLERRMDRLGLDRSHLRRKEQSHPRARRQWTDQQLADVVRTSSTVAEVARRLGYQPSGGVHRLLRHHMARLDLSTEHFAGQSWSKGKSVARRAQRPLTEILVRGSTYANNGALRKRLMREGLKPRHCELCQLDEWHGHRLPLELDHINGEPTDNRLENLRILCPNCHAVTDTWRRSRRAGVAQLA